MQLPPACPVYALLKCQVAEAVLLALTHRAAEADDLGAVSRRTGALTVIPIDGEGRASIPRAIVATFSTDRVLVPRWTQRGIIIPMEFRALLVTLAIDSSEWPAA